ncbi:MAG: DUF1572 domain-containing protein [Bacteroidia bacterium]|nr:DUF1572 family protein [Bacteroidia bacterium]MCZ2278076.1 DUF1572 domain-containing protein [Bacteroidia bacterium]
MNRSSEWLFLFKRDLATLRKEVGGFKSPDLLWETVPGISNPAGNLTLHLCGNLRHYIGGVLNNSGYARNRDAEFSLKHILPEELIQTIDTTEKEVESAFNQLTNEQLQAQFPAEVLGKNWICESFIIHLYGHLNYHLGQINYLRRFLHSNQ